MAGPQQVIAAKMSGWRQSRPIAFYLAILVLVMVLPAFIFSALLLARNNEAQQSVLETLIVSSTRAIVQAVDREIFAKTATLKVLATTPSLISGDYRAFHAQTRDALADTGNYVYLLDSQFSVLLSTRAEFDTEPIAVADTETPSRALETRDAVVSNVVFGQRSQSWVFNILYPVFLPGQEPMVLGLNQSAEALSVTLLNNKLPDGWNVAIVDRAGAVLAASPGAAESGSRFELFDPATVETSGALTRQTAGNEPYRVSVGRSLLSEWYVVAWAPSRVVDAPFGTSLVTLIAGGAIFLLGASVLVLYLAREIQKSVRGLVEDARRLGVGEQVPAADYPISEIAEVSQTLHEASRQRVAADSEVRFLLRELAHRSKNQMTVIGAMAKQTAKTEKTLASFLASFEKRIMGLARSTDLLLSHGSSGIELGDIILHQLEPFAPEEDGRVELSGAPIRLNSQAAQIIGMAAHELATNAVKYGAFLDETGKLRVSWEVAGGNVILVWRETVKPLRRRAPRVGFGTTVLQTMVGRSFGAQVERILHRNGIEWRFSIPLASLNPELAPDKVAAAETAPEPAEAGAEK